SNTVSVSNAIGGTGTLTHASSGTVILTGTNTYTGPTTISAGTLQIGSGGTTGTLGSGAVTDNGTLVFDRSNAISITNAIFGNGGMTQAGSGTVTLTAADGYSGATVINNGTLALSGSGDISASSGVTDNGSFDISGITATSTSIKALTGTGTVALGAKNLTISAGTGTFGGSFTGTGALELSGGTTTITGTVGNKFQVDTGATLQVGDGGTTGAVNGAITNNGTLAFERSDTVTFANAVSGTGALTKMGVGTLILTGANSYAGATTISTGTLQVGNGGTSGSLGTGAVTDNGMLAFDRSDTITITNAISGSGGLIQAGSGTLIYDGAGTFTGTTMVQSGILEVGDAATPGASLGGGANVSSGATLIGHGSVHGAVAVASGGTLRPGGSIGTLTVNGNVSLPAGSTFIAEVSPAAASQLLVNGAASLGGNLQIVQDAGTYTAGTDFKLISATSLSGTFAAISGDSFPGLNSTIQYSATGVDLILSSPVGTPPPVTVTYLFASYGTTLNQTAAGAALSAGAPTGALYTAAGTLVTSAPAAAPGVLTQLSGDLQASIASAAIEDSRLIRNAVLEQLSRSHDGVNVWADGFGGYGGIASDGNASAMHHTASGVVGGVDVPLADGVRVGIAGAYSANGVSSQNRQSQASGHMAHIIGYAGYTAGGIALDIGGEYGSGTLDATRVLAAFGQSDASRRDQRLDQVFGRVGYRVAVEQPFLEPYLGIAHVDTAAGAFAETGGSTTLSGTGQSEHITYSMLGVQSSLDGVNVDGMTLTPRADIAWDHAFNRVRPVQMLTFQNAATSFTVLGVPLAQDSAAVQLGLDLAITPHATLSLSYDGNLSSTADSHAVRGGLAWRF
ncbi:MAG TPA: autotransporter domain-containing protein, partial [Rhizomicrobium sp.]|nr:autotransporter domain-containing protein [Rhizomicrobium sp.]